MLLVYLDLREIGVVCEVCHKVVGDAPLHVQARIGMTVVPDSRIHCEIGPKAGNRVRFDLEISARRRSFDADEGAVQRYPVRSRPTGPAHGKGKPGQVIPLVAPPHAAAKLDAPHLFTARAIPQGPKGDRHLHGPSLLELACPNLPDWVPVPVGAPLVVDLVVGEGS